MAKRILIIDDDPDILEIFDLIFTPEGYEVILSRTGEEVDYVQQLNPDLILLDVRITTGNRDGVQLCSQLKSQASTSRFPVILVSAERDLSEIATECRADGFISKPFNITELTTRVKEILFLNPN